jgi:hypothetical protein
MPKSKRRRGVTIEMYREIALSFPGVEEGTSYGTLAFRVQKKFMSRLKEDGESIVVKPVGFEEQDAMMRNEPDKYFLTDHYRGYPCILVRLGNATVDDMRMLIEQCWRRLASKQLLNQLSTHRPDQPESRAAPGRATQTARPSPRPKPRRRTRADPSG